MNAKRRLLVFTLALTLSGVCLGAESASLDPHLEPLRPLLGKTWKGEFKNSTPSRPVVDISRWERALNGRAVRILHSINDGAYGGESIIRWDEKKQSVVYHYFTTAGFTTTGTVRFDGNKLITHESVSGGSDGITEVRAVNELAPDGSFHVKSEYLKNGLWVPGRDVTYREDKSAQVIFK